MANVTLWKKVGVSMQSVIGADVTIQSISKASPGVVGATAHGLLDGEYALLTVVGMSQVNNRIVRAANKTVDTFEMEGIDSTLFDTFTSGKLNKLTFGTSFGTFLDVTASGGEAPDIDTTTIHDDQASAIPGLPAASVFSFNSLWDGADVALQAAKSASDISAKRGFLIAFANGQKYLINGYISCTLNPAGSAQEKVTTPVKITSNGLSTTYAS
jgi:tail tube protein